MRDGFTAAFRCATIAALLGVVKRPVGRPRKEPEEKQTERVTVNLTPSELETLEKHAQGEDLAKVARELLLEHPVFHATQNVADTPSADV